MIFIAITNIQVFDLVMILHNFTTNKLVRSYKIDHG